MCALEAGGVTWRLGQTVLSIDRQGDPILARTNEREILAVETVLLATGLRPNISLAREAGLDVGAGIKVDESGRTGDASIYALGD